MADDEYGAHPAYGTPRRPEGQYGPPPSPPPAPYPHPAPYAYPAPGYGGPGGYDPAYIAGPRRVPGTLTAARVLAYVRFGLAAFGFAVAVALLDGDAQAAGRVFAGVLFPLVAFVLAIRAKRGRRAMRAWWIAVESMVILTGLGSLGNGGGGGLFFALFGVAAVVLLSLTSTGDYFRTPREHRA